MICCLSKQDIFCSFSFFLSNEEINSHFVPDVLWKTLTYGWILGADSIWTWSPTQTSPDLQFPRTRVFSPAPLEMLQLSEKCYSSCTKDYSKFCTENLFCLESEQTWSRSLKYRVHFLKNLVTSLPFNKHKGNGNFCLPTFTSGFFPFLKDTSLLKKYFMLEKMLVLWKNGKNVH